MKKIIIFSALLLTGTLAEAQDQDKSLAFEEKKFVWSGIDYSNAKFIGSEEFGSVNNLTSFFDTWNQLMINEAHKFDFKKHYLKDSRVDELSIADARNEKVDAEESVINSEYSFDEGQLEEIVAAYKGVSDESDLGLLYVVEYFFKDLESANGKVHVVFFNTNTGKIAWHKEYISKAGGFGFRNYWAAVIYNTLKVSGVEFVKESKKFKKGS